MGDAKLFQIDGGTSQLDKHQEPGFRAVTLIGLGALAFRLALFRRPEDF